MIACVNKAATNSANRGAVRQRSITADEAGQRIDNFLLHELKGLPKSRVYRLLRRGEVRVNRGRIGPEYRLREDDIVRIPPVVLEARAPAAAVPQSWAERLAESVLYENDGLIVLNKPSGLAVHGGSGLDFGLIEALRRLRPKAPFLELVHRLDRDTSGCLVVAKRRSTLRELHDRFRTGEGLEKRYLALLAGNLPRGRVPVELRLDRKGERGGERLVRVSAQGKIARSVFKAVTRFDGATLAEVVIDTGRTHQIRVHAAAIGHPVAGDEKYGDKGANRRFRALGLRRLFLHAASLSFPLEGSERSRNVTAEAPLGNDLRNVLERLSEADNRSRGGRSGG